MSKTTEKVVDVVEQAAESAETVVTEVAKQASKSWKSFANPRVAAVVFVSAAVVATGSYLYLRHRASKDVLPNEGDVNTEN